MSNFDEALERLHQVALEYGDGLANHGPMGAEALESLGHHALIPAFVNIYVPRLPVFKPGRPLADADRAQAYGQVTRAADWVATFESRLEGEDWRAVIAAEVPGLLPGLFAGAGHGLLRTAHGIRALEREDSPVRRRELARGLAYWAARFQTLPGSVGAGRTTARLALADALADWPLLEDPSARAGLFFRVVERLAAFRPFADAVEAVAVPERATLDEFLDALCAQGAEIYVANPHARVAYVHAVTIPSALRTLVPYLADDDARSGALYSLRAVGALHTIYGNRVPAPEHDDEVVRITQDWDEIRYHAACSIQEHSIKMVEACWREDKRRPHPAFRRAAADAALKIEGRGQAAVC